MSSLVRWQIVGTGVGLALTLLAFLTAAGLKRWVSLPLAGRRTLLGHRYVAWTSLAIYGVIAAACLKFHFPTARPLAALDYGWFIIHFFNGALGLPLYVGKILVVRKWRGGCRAPGILFGGALLLFWLIQVGTIVPSLLAWISG